MKLSKPLRQVFAVAALTAMAGGSVAQDLAQEQKAAAPVDHNPIAVNMEAAPPVAAAVRHDSFVSIMKALGVSDTDIMIYDQKFNVLIRGISQYYVDPQKADFQAVHKNVLDGMNEALAKNPQATLENLAEAGFDKALHALDPHSDYMNAKEWEGMNKSMAGQFAGFGIRTTKESDNAPLVIEELINDQTPAAKAGLKPGDKITHVNGTSLIGMSTAEAMEALSGKKGEKAVLKIERAGEPAPMDVSVVRDIIPVSPVSSRVIDNDVGYIRLYTFSDNADAEMDKAINKIETDTQGHVKSYILDLRFNGGGRLDQAAEVVDNFINSGTIVSSLNNKGKGSRFVADKGDMLNGKPLVLLVNGYSASASEIVSGSLQDHGRAKIVGGQTFGKGSVQSVLPLSLFQKQTAIKLTTALYYTANGRSIQNVGVTPDIRTEFAIKADVKEAGLDQTIVNPKGTNANTAHSPQTCGKNPAYTTVDPANVGKDYVFKNMKGEQTIDYDLLCAVQALKGNNHSPYVRIQDNKPQQPAQKPALPALGS